MKNNLYLKILHWAYEKNGANFTRKDLQDAFKLNLQELEQQLIFFKPPKITDRLIDSREDGYNLFLTSKGMSEVQRHFNKRWWERNWVQIFFFLGAIASIVGLIIYFNKN